MKRNLKAMSDNRKEGIKYVFQFNFLWLDLSGLWS